MKIGDICVLKRDESFLVIDSNKIVTAKRDDIVLLLDIKVFRNNDALTLQESIRFYFCHPALGIIWNGTHYINEMSGYSYYRYILTVLD